MRAAVGTASDGQDGVAWGSSAGGTGLLSDSGIGDNGFPAPANEVIAWLDKAFPGGDLVHYEQDPECDDYNMEDYLEWEHPALDGVVGFVRGPGDSEFWLVEWSLIGESDSSWQLGGDLSWLSLGMTIEDASLQLEAQGRQVTQEWLSTEEGSDGQSCRLGGASIEHSLDPGGSGPGWGTTSPGGRNPRRHPTSRG